jgi:hypothetical protein
MTLVLAGVLLAGAAIAEIEPPPAAAPPCRATEVSRNLDFWLGDWDVYVGTELAGRDTVERILDGCGSPNGGVGADLTTRGSACSPMTRARICGPRPG